MRGIIAIATLLILFNGCTKKRPIPVIPSNQGEVQEEVVGSGNLAGDGIKETQVNSSSKTNKEVLGGVNAEGKYTGSDGVSASGIKFIYFASDRYDLESDQIARLNSDLPKIKALTKSGKIRIEGNCDEMGTDEYNHALGLKRARAVRDYLINHGIDASKMDIISYGESNPVCTGHSEACHAKNRRVEINKI
ncbi:MAG: OmpA family protein [Epsilonproteobacteria bacterium]|nr:OmpA family protein [Campylobacterota bacterium]